MRSVSPLLAVEASSLVTTFFVRCASFGSGAPEEGAADGSSESAADAADAACPSLRGPSMVRIDVPELGISYCVDSTEVT